jgi:outer membrane lipopolysaccharide assembly protein LptE/RlpB
MKSSIRNFFLFTAFLLIGGCGYHLVGTGTTLPPYMKTIAIPVFSNTSSQPTIHRDITNSIRQSFINDGRLKVVSDPKKADLVMKGVLINYTLQAVSFTAQDIAREYYVLLGGKINVKDQVKKRTFLKQNFSTKWDFQTEADVVNSEAARQLALQDAYRVLGNRLVSIVIDQF